tara:strand:+ start:32309 stop:32488 length:180 start_codon:yes stop_codon:yes gene_type:complete
VTYNLIRIIFLYAGADLPALEATIYDHLSDTSLLLHANRRLPINLMALVNGLLKEKNGP